jgi:hypothetical protein
MSFIRKLNRQYFGHRLSPDVLALLDPIDDQRLEVQQFVARMFRPVNCVGHVAVDPLELPPPTHAPD